MSVFQFQDMLQADEQQQPYRLLTKDFVSTLRSDAGDFLKIDPAGLTRLTQEAMHDIAHFLRPGHLAQLASILKDPEAPANDHFVALELLKNANIAAAGVLPGCQDTGTAIGLVAHVPYPSSVGNRPSTIQEKEIHLRFHLKPTLGSLPLDKVRGEAVSRLLTNLRGHRNGWRRRRARSWCRWCMDATVRLGARRDALDGVRGQ